MKITEEEYFRNPWFYKDRSFISELIDDNYGFVYCITNRLTGKKYIGRKYFWSLRKTKKSRKRVKSESDWKSYYGSCDQLKKDVEEFGKENFKREIISLHKTKGITNYSETKQQFLNEVLESKNDLGEPLFYNDNILARYYRTLFKEKINE